MYKQLKTSLDVESVDYFVETTRAKDAWAAPGGVVLGLSFKVVDPILVARAKPEDSLAPVYTQN